MAEKTAELIQHVKDAPGFHVPKFMLPESMEGQTLIDLDLRHKHQVNVIALHDAARGESALNPDPTQPLAKGDILYILGLLEDLEKFQESFSE